jgi:hypothetical protein
MRCPKCGSENVTVQMVAETRVKKKSGLVYWLLIGWWLEPILWIFFTVPRLLFALFKPRRHKTKTVYSSMCVCQNCGNRWKVK